MPNSKKLLLTLSTTLVVTALLTSTALAQGTSPKIETGYLTATQGFDANGDKQDGAATYSEIPIDVSVHQGIGHGAGIDLMARGTVKNWKPNDDVAGDTVGQQSGMGAREAVVGLSYFMPLMDVVDVAVRLGYKHDLGKKPEDLANDEMSVSDGNSAAYFHLGVGTEVAKGLGVTGRLGVVNHLESSGDVKVQMGLLIDLSLTVEYSLGELPLSFGLIAGQTTQGDAKVAGVDVTDTGFTVTHLAPFASYSTGSGTLSAQVGGPLEDFTVGFPILGTSFPALVGGSVAYTAHFSFF